MRYAIWNNKGGVGKSFLTFVLSTEYALKHPERKVCVVDMCPQANVSEILLGGNGRGYEKIAEILAQENRKTVGGYFDSRLSRPDEKTGNEGAYYTLLSGQGQSLPQNLYLVCGDPSLELQVQSINQLASVDLPENRWRNVHTWLKDLQEGISVALGQQVTFFIDCNPSFATYTAQALLASDRIIVPCTADGASARAMDNIGKLIYGRGVPENYGKTAFHYKARQAELTMPRMLLIAFNRHTTSKNMPSSAFAAMYKAIEERAEGISDQFVEDKCEFHNIPDAHTVSIVACEKALPVSKMVASKYSLAHGDTQVNKEPLERYRCAIREMVESLS